MPGELIFELFLIVLIFKNFLMILTPIIPGLIIFGFQSLTKADDINDFEKTYLNIGRFEKYIFIGMGGSISMARIASFINRIKNLLF